MIQNKLLYIHGWHVSGKTTLAKLLDGHNQLAVMPYHDILPSAFEKASRDQIPYDVAAREFQRNIISTQRIHQILSKSRYHRFQSFNYGRPVKLVASSEEVRETTLGEFNFCEFERAWIERVNSDIQDNTVSITFDDILQIIIEEFFRHWNSYPYDQKKCEYFVGYGEKRSKPMEYLLENHKGSKVIFIRRDPRGCIASKSPKPETNQSVFDLLQTGAIYEIERLFRDVRNLKQKYTKRLMVISFEDLIVNTDETITDIANFLDIENQQILTTPTFRGQDIGEEDHIGEIQDTWRDMLSRQETEIAELQMGERGLLSVNPQYWRFYFHAETMRRVEKFVKKIGIEPLAKKIKNRMV